MKKLDCSHSLHGSVMGLIVLCISIATLAAFYGIKEDEEGEEHNTEDQNGENIQSTPLPSDQDSEDKITNVTLEWILSAGS